MTLESQYEAFKASNTSTFTFEEWKIWYGESLVLSLHKMRAVEYLKSIGLIDQCETECFLRDHNNTEINIVELLTNFKIK